MCDMHKSNVKAARLLMILSILEKHKFQYIICVLLSAIFSSGAYILLSLSIGRTITLVQYRYYDGLMVIAVLLLLSVILHCVSAPITYLYTVAVNHAIARVRQRISDKYMRISYQHHDTNVSGDVLSRFTSDVDLLNVLFVDLIPASVYFITFGLIAFITALYINWWAAIAFIAIGLLFERINVKLSARVKCENQRMSKQRDRLIQSFVDAISAINVIKIFNAEKVFYNLFKHENRIFTKFSLNTEKLKAYQQASNDLLTNVIGNSALIIGGFLALNQVISLPMLLVLNHLAGAITTAFQWTGPVVTQAVTLSVAVDRVSELLSLDEEVYDDRNDYIVPEMFSNNSMTISFENVSFKYKAKYVLQDISFTMTKGQRIAFVGESGSGKTTLFKLLLGFYAPAKGEIFINQRNISQMHLDQLRSYSAYVPQDSILLNDTIKMNIKYGNLSATDDDIINVAKLANLDEFVYKQSGKYDTVVGTNGEGLSGGERHRVTIARAVLKDAGVLLFDEPTASLDSKSQTKFNSMISDMNNKLVIVITHRLEGLENFDRVYVMKDGKILENGTHDELLNEQGKYFEMYETSIENPTT